MLIFRKQTSQTLAVDWLFQENLHACILTHLHPLYLIREAAKSKVGKTGKALEAGPLKKLFFCGVPNQWKTNGKENYKWF